MINTAAQAPARERRHTILQESHFILSLLQIYSLLFDSWYIVYIVLYFGKLNESLAVVRLMALTPFAIALQIYLRSGLSLKLDGNRTSLMTLLSQVLSPVRHLKVLVLTNVFFAVVNSFQQPVIALLVSKGIAASPGHVPVGSVIGYILLAWAVGSGSAQILAYSQAKLTGKASDVLGRRVAIAGGLLEGDAEQLPSAFSQGIAKCQQAWDACFYQLFPSLLKVVVQFIFLATVSPRLSFALLSFIPLIQSLQDLKAVAMKSSKKYNKRLGEQQHMLTNMIELRLTTRMLQEQTYVMGRWDELATETVDLANASFLWAATYGVVLAALNWLVYITGVSLLFVGYNSNNKGIDLQAFIAANGYLLGLVSPLNGWANSFNKLLLFSGPVQKLSDLLDKNKDIAKMSKQYPRGRKKASVNPEPKGQGNPKPKPKEDCTSAELEIVVDCASPHGANLDQSVVDEQGASHAVEKSLAPFDTHNEAARDSPDVLVENAAFTFPGAESPALDSLSLQIPAKSFAGLTGPSGSGKTTLLRLLGRAGDQLSSGRILVGGLDPLCYKHTAICLQAFVTLNASIRENITFGSRYNTLDDVTRAAQAAEIHDAIMKLPNGYDTVIGTASEMSLSGGQLARLGLARALCRRPRLLLCDEITSPLDAVTEEAIIQTLQKLHKRQGLTIVLCTHSMRAAAATDIVFVMVNGKLGQEPGPFKELSEAVDSPLYNLVHASD